MAYDGLINSTSFSGHESFPLRFAWLKKGYDNLQRSPGFFSEKDAMVELGVGKNMVRAIRHWGLACDVWTEKDGSRGREIIPTCIGASLLADDGWDPFLEDPGTIWWLHWSLVRNPDRATTWTWFFGIRGGTNRLSRQELVSEIFDLQGELSGRSSPRSSIKRDVDVLIRSYIRDPGARRTYEDALDAPLAQLGIVRPGTEKGSIELLSGDWPTLPIGAFEAMLLDYCAARKITNAPLNELLYGRGSPGRILRLTEAGLVRRLVELRRNGWQFDETSGLRQLMIPANLESPATQLGRYYSKASRQEVA